MAEDTEDTVDTVEKVMPGEEDITTWNPRTWLKQGVYASPLLRIIASLVDLVIVFLIITALNTIMLRVLPEAAKVPTLVYTTLYFVLFWGWRGQTPAKMALGIKIVRSGGSSLGFPRALLRYLVGFLGLILFLILTWLTESLALQLSLTLVALALIGFTLIFGPHSQGIHDKLAGSYVINLRWQPKEEVEEGVEEESKEAVKEEAEEDIEEVESPSP